MRGWAKEGCHSSKSKVQTYDLSNVIMNATVSAVAWFRIPDIPALLKLSTEPSPLGKGTINSHPATSSEKGKF